MIRTKATLHTIRLTEKDIRDHFGIPAEADVEIHISNIEGTRRPFQGLTFAWEENVKKEAK